MDHWKREYQNNPKFHRLVETIFHLIKEFDFDENEIAQATKIAFSKYSDYEIQISNIPFEKNNKRRRGL